MRHLSFSRSTSKRLQKLTAFLVAVAMVAGFLPLGAVKVFANEGDFEVAVEVESIDNANYNSTVKVQFNDNTSWTDADINSETGNYIFPASAITTDQDGDDYINVRFVFEKAEGDPRVITGFKAVTAEKTAVPVLDKYLSDDLCTMTIPYPVNVGITGVTLRVSNPNNIEFNQSNDSNDNFYQFLKNRNLSSLTIPDGKKLEIYGANTTITGSLTLGEKSCLNIMNNRDANGDIISTGTLAAGSIVGAKDSRIMLETKSNIPTGLTIYRWGADGLEELPDDYIGDDWNWFELNYFIDENNQGYWVLNEFDPFTYSICVDKGSNLIGATLTYGVSYSLDGGATWKAADIRSGLPEDFQYFNNISSNEEITTVTIDNCQNDLMELFFRLPDTDDVFIEDPQGSEDPVYPNVEFRITVPNSDELKLIGASLGGGDDKVDLMNTVGDPDEFGNVIVSAGPVDIYEGPHDFILKFDSEFDKNDYYGLSVQIPMDENSGYSVSADGKTVTLDSIGNNKLIVDSTNPIIVENIPGTETDPALTVLWSASDKFDLTATTDGTTAYIYNATEEGSRDKLSADDPFTVTCSTKGTPVTADVNFEKPCLSFSGYASITPAPGTGDNWEGDLTAASYDVVFENGTVTVELLDTDSAWYGHLEHRFDEQDNDYIDEFRIETTAQVKLTFTPEDGYEVDPWAIENFKLDDDLSCTYTMSTENNHIDHPFREEGGNPPDPQGGNKVTFTGATGMTDTDTDDGIVVINYEHGSVTFTQGDGTMKDGDIFNPVWDSETKTVTIEFNLEASFTIAADPNYDSTCKINNDEQEYQDTYTFAPSPNTNVDITFMGPTFVLEVGGKLKEDTTYEVDDSGTKITLTYDHGKVEITNFASLVDVTPVTPGGSSVVISYEFTLEGNKADVKFIPDEDYIFSGMHLDRKEVAPDDERINNCVLSLTGIDKNNKVSVEPRFDLTPELKIVKVNAGETIGYDSSTKTLTFSENEINKGTVTITNESDPFSGNPQDYSEITSDITFTITPADGYVCFVKLNNGQELYFPTADTYTLKASDLRSDPVEGNENILTFEFKKLEEDQLAKVKFNGAVDSSGDYYRVSYIDAVAGVQLGSVKISKDAIESCDEETSTFTIKQDVSSLELTITPKTGYIPKLVEYGPEYGDDQTVIGEWTRELTLTNNNGTYSYTLAINPQGGEPVGLRVSFDSTKYLQSTVTYKTYEGEQCAVEIGGTGVPGGDLNNKLVEYQTPLSLTADENSKEYVKVVDGKEYVCMQFSVPFTYYMSEVKVNGVDYSTDLPAGYDELIAAFGNQYTNAVIWVEIADSYVIETKAYKGVFDEDPTKTTLAVGNFLWCYDRSKMDCQDDEYVENAYLEIVQVVYDGKVYTKDNITQGSAISWADIEKDNKIVGGQATLPAGSYVTMKFIPDYGTQLVSLGLNGNGNFTVDQGQMYTYSFYVGPGNFHLQAAFAKVPDVVEASATAVDGGSIALGDGTVDNGTAVLYVGDANVAGAEKTNFENLAADEALEISSYLDISLDKVVYQGVSADEVKYDGDGKNVWTSGLNDLAKPATVTLTLTDDIGDGTVKVLHNHNGNLEVIDADYNPATKEITFQTDSFSNYAIAVVAEKYTVTFNANGYGTAPAAQTVTSGSKATKPTDPTASGYTFGGWYTDSACTKAYSFDTAVTANITLYAKWTAVTTPAPSTPAPTNTTTPTPTPEPEIVPSAELIPSGTAHVQDVGDVPVSVDPETGIMTIGTTGQGKRLEEITIDFENTTGLSGTMEYRVHVQDKGWLPWTEAGNPAGTEGESKRIEAIEIRLTGELAEYYSVEYCVHIQDYGDMQGWVADGALAGTTGESKRIEQIKVRIVPKGSGDSMSVKYRVHIEDFGWEGSYASGGAMSGTSGQSKRLEAIEIFLTGVQYSGGIKYKTHVQDIGWESSWAQNGEMSGTQGQAKRLEGISIELYGEVAEYYDIYYRVHAQDIGWMGWAKNGEYAGTAGRSARLEGIQIVLVPKGGAAPGATYNGITAATDKAFIEGF